MTEDKNDAKIRDLKRTIEVKDQEITNLDSAIIDNRSDQVDKEKELREVNEELASGSHLIESEISKLGTARDKARDEVHGLEQEIFQAKREHGGAYQAANIEEAEILSLEKEIAKEENKLKMFETKKRKISSADKRKLVDVESILEKTAKILGGLNAEKARLHSEIESAKQEQVQYHAAQARADSRGKTEAELRAEDRRRELELTNPRVRQAEADMRKLDRELAQLEDEEKKIDQKFEEITGEQD